MRAPLTEVQQKIYSYLVKYIREHGFPPTIREIQSYFNYNSSNSVVTQLNKIETKGYITKSSSKDGMRARTMRLVDDIVGIHTVESAQLGKALKKIAENGYKIKLNEAVELLSALNIRLV